MSGGGGKEGEGKKRIYEEMMGKIAVRRRKGKWVEANERFGRGKRSGGNLRGARGREEERGRRGEGRKRGERRL